MGLIGLLMACYGGLYWILSGLTKSTDHSSALESLHTHSTLHMQARAQYFKHSGQLSATLLPIAVLCRMTRYI